MSHPANRAAVRHATAAPALIALAILAGALLPAACGPPPPTSGRDDIEDAGENYAISGRSGQELRWALDRLGPENDAGGRSACAALHENGHRRIYLDGVARFRRRIEALGGRPGCGALDEAVNRLADEELRFIQDEQVAYEERTDHGYAQCGRFP